MMKSFLLRLFFATFTLVTAGAVTVFWLFENKMPEIAAPPSQKLYDSNIAFDYQIIDEDKTLWLNDVLGRFKEKPLESLADSIDETYRLILLPSFDKPVSIRIWRVGNEKFLTVKRLSGINGYRPEEMGKLTSEKKRALTEGEWQDFTRLLNDSFFWGLPLIDRTDEPVPDGALWIVEGNKNKTYHEVQRLTPNKEVKETCNYMLRLASLEKEYEGY